MAISIPQSARQAAANAIVDLADAGSGSALTVIRSGSPGDPDSAAAGNEVATIVMGDPAFSAADPDGIASAIGLNADTNATGGIAGHYRIEDSDGNCVFQGVITGVGGGGDLELQSTTVGAGGTVVIVSLKLQVPES